MSPRKFSPQIAVVGPANAGKTTLIQTLTRAKHIGKTAPTIGFDVKRIRYKGIEFVITDLGGQKPFVLAFWDKILPKTDGIIFLIDAAAPNHFVLAHDLFLYVLKKMNNVPMLILANKQDLPTAASIESLEQIFNFEKARMRFGITALHIAPTSALLGEGVTEALDWLVTQMSLNAGYNMPLIHDGFIYHRLTGRPLAVIRGTKLETLIKQDNKQNVDLNEDEKILQGVDATLISAFYSALSSFSQEITKSTVQCLKLRNSDPTRPDHLLFNYMDDESPLSCLIIATDGDNELLLELVASRILDHVKEHHSWALKDEIGSSRQIIDLTDQAASLIGRLIRNREDSRKKKEQDITELTWAKDLLTDKHEKSKTTHEGPPMTLTEPVTVHSEPRMAFAEPEQASTPKDLTTASLSTRDAIGKDPTTQLRANNEKTLQHSDNDSLDTDTEPNFHRLSVRERIRAIEKRRKRKNQY